MSAFEIIAIIVACILAVVVLSWLIKTGWIDVSKWIKNARAAKKEFTDAEEELVKVKPKVDEAKENVDELKNLLKLKEECEEKVQFTADTLRRKIKARQLREKLEKTEENQKKFLATNVDFIKEHDSLKERAIQLHGASFLEQEDSDIGSETDSSCITEISLCNYKDEPACVRYETPL